jgi:VWFA-related protein
MCRLVKVTSVISLLIAATSLAQVRETIDVHLVEVPVTVTDRDGNPVRGLTAQNFELFDDGQKRPVTSFDQIDFGSRESLQSSPLNPAARRSFLLLFDMSFSSPVGRAKAQEAAKNFIARGLQRHDHAAIGTVDVERGFRLLTSFTTDRNMLTAAIVNPLTFHSSDPLQLTGTETVEPPSDSFTRSGEGTTSIPENLVEIYRGEKRMNDSYNRTRIERQFTILGGIARTLRILPGRKQVVFFSEGFDAKLVQGRDAKAALENANDAELAVRGEGYKTDSDARYGSSTSFVLLEEMRKYFRGSDVILNAVDIAGVRVANDLQKGKVLNSNEGLFIVSHSTGGTVFQNSNDLNEDLQRMLRQQEVVYVLGFRATGSKPGKFHDVRVKINGVPGARLQHRAGYWERSGENPLERVLTNAEIVVNDLKQDEIGVATLAVPFPNEKKSHVPVIIEINGADLLRDAKEGPLVAEVYIYAFDDDGAVRDRMFDRVKIDPAQAGDRLRAGGIKYYATLSLSEGRYAIKTLVRVPQSERKGYARTDIVVSPPNAVAVTPPLFPETGTDWVMIRGGSHDETNAPYPFHINGESFIPSASVRFRTGEARDFAVFIANVNPDELSWQALMSDYAGAPQATTTSLLKQLQHEDITKMVFRFDPTGAAVGTALLDFAVQKKGSSDSRHAAIGLNIQK